MSHATIHDIVGTGIYSSCANCSNLVSVSDACLSALASVSGLIYNEAITIWTRDASGVWSLQLTICGFSYNGSCFLDDTAAAALEDALQTALGGLDNVTSVGAVTFDVDCQRSQT